MFIAADDAVFDKVGEPTAEDVAPVVATVGFVTVGPAAVDGGAPVLAGGETDGRVVDACRRVLGLPTPPAPGSPQVWATVVWVDAVLAATLAADLGEPPGWHALAALDPLDHAGDRAGLTWSLVRASCAAGLVVVPGVDAELAAWMDDGMFAREATAALPPLFDMLHDLRDLLAPHVLDHVLARVAERLAA